MYNNALLTVTNVSTPDPFLVQAHGKAYMTFTAGDRVEIWSSDDPLSFRHSRTTKSVVWRPPLDTAYSAEIWAPELHNMWGQWYIYFAAARAREGNKSHRMYALAGPPSTADPTSGKWSFAGEIKGLPPSQWAIDGTVFPFARDKYFIYSGWPLDNPTTSDRVQELFIVKLASPTLATTHPPARISTPRHPWEFSGAQGINEGPQLLFRPPSPGATHPAWLGISYSCAGSWTPEYKMNTLRYLGGDPLIAANWRKAGAPLLQRRQGGGAAGPYGPGHGSFVEAGGETVGVFHATDGKGDRWEGRKARAQKVLWTDAGPVMGEVGREVGDVAVFMAGWKGSHWRRPWSGAHGGMRGWLRKNKEKIWGR